MLPLGMRNHKAALKAEFEGIDRTRLAKKLGSSRKTIDQIVVGFRRCSPKRALEIEHATKGRVRKEVLRPDIFFGRASKRG